MRLILTATAPVGAAGGGTPSPGPQVDLLVEAEASSSVNQLASSIAPVLGLPPHQDNWAPRLYVGQRQIAGHKSLTEAGLYDGAVVSVGLPGPSAEEPAAVAEVRVVSGPSCGLVHRLDPGDYTIGDALAARVPVDSAGMSVRVRVHADGTVTVLSVDGDAVTLETDPIEPGTAWLPGRQLVMGDSLLEAHPTQRADASVLASSDGTGLDYNRPPRLHPAPTRTNFRLPTPPEPPDRPLVQLAVMVLLPLLMAVGSALVLQRPHYLLIGLLAPVSVIVMQMLQRRTSKMRYEKDVKEYEEKVERITADATEALHAEQRARRDACPDPAAALLLATGPRARLWERRRTDEDFTLLRVGTGEIPSKVVLTDPTKDDHRKEVTWRLRDVPVTVSLRDNGVVGVAGRGERVDALNRWLVGQLAVLHSPTELELYILSLGRDEPQWAWTRWLPHLRGRTTGGPLSRIGVDAETCARRIAELLAIVDARSGPAAAGADPGSEIVVVLDGARRMRSLPGVVQLLREGPAAGVYVLCLDTEERLLPEECQAVVSVSSEGLRLSRTKYDSVEQVRVDAPPASWAERVGRALAPIRDSGTSEEDGTLPRSARLLDVMGLEPPDAEVIAAHWAAGGRSTVATLGVGVDGPFSVDIRRDGPHALIAGTTGSGKSELLQTLVASLAAVNRPEAMSFVLVDYKGGSAFKDCVKLPHTVGMVTDLDTHLVGRALTSLGAELRRREHILAKAGAKDIEDYIELLDRDPQLPAMPRLLLVIDEFASMARELPDFIKGLVNIAQRGRSLGIHLVLATQRPGGVVTNDIRANTNLRIALRMTDPAESRDVIDAVEAAQIGIDTPGRAYARLGHASLLPFQSGRVGGRRVVMSTTASAPEPRPLRWNDFAAPAPMRRRAESTESGDVEVTDLTVLVSAIQEAGERVQVQRQPSPWLPALPTALTLGEMLRGSPISAPRPGAVQAVPIGLIDQPEVQAQRAYTIDLSSTGHLHVIGSGRTGRSQALRTIAGALALGHDVTDLHMYGIDCGNGALLPLTELPHCGAVVARTQEDRVIRLMGLLGQELERRQRLLAAHGCADINELRATLPEQERPAHIVVFLDRVEAFEQVFQEYNHGALIEDLVTLLRDGAAVGVHLFLAGDRTLARTRYATTTEERLILRFNDRNDYSQVGLTSRKLPENIPDGRAFRSSDAAEVQLAMLARDPAGAAQAAELSRIGAFVKRRISDSPAQRPFRVDVLPDQLTYEQADAYRSDARGPLWALVGVGGNELTAYGADLARTPTFLIGGPPRSGRSSLLLNMARSLIAGGSQLMLVTPRSSPLLELKGHPGVPAVLDSANPLLSDFRESIGRLTADTGVIVIDDAELLLNSDLGKEFSRIARGLVGEGWGVIAAGTTEALQGGFSGWHVHLKRNRMGALLSPQSSSDGEILGLRLPKGVASSRITLGTAYLHLADGQLVQVKVPIP
ncbi:DNA segregation ATPase FtsK/SpoIIIE, S-DNA-T family [Marinactinospora thermotolerans DSM 45154]|uniref:DNA segregation ATPase FtsK/SpoIIIE, S-DNA-T family n=1 Tax=Marinactinospora thermotolerans DSM 45154 TaxID=1122192 RepID=A0A1T4N654_9ACTN|nr:FtsK/SpoIIIE domain-containing protein [Marinactinospora thermotolerans]SJZ74641.1 DNA segregation ATPase FtsK/SpoIIIE, S-DNA-T family [Marinactinospora thermotolerans DSM 45154]